MMKTNQNMTVNTQEKMVKKSKVHHKSLNKLRSVRSGTMKRTSLMIILIMRQKIMKKKERTNRCQSKTNQKNQSLQFQSMKVKTSYQFLLQEDLKRQRPADLLAHTHLTKAERVENRTLLSKRPRLLNSSKTRLNLVPITKTQMMLKE